MNVFLITYYTLSIAALLASFMMMSMMDPVTRVGALIRQVHMHQTMRKHRTMLTHR